MTPAELRALVRNIPDHPKPGILFRDVTTLLLHAQGFAAAIRYLAATVRDQPDLVAGMEARGFVVATALALNLGAGLLLIRKDGKLPGATIAEPGFAAAFAGIWLGPATTAPRLRESLLKDAAPR